MPDDDDKAPAPPGSFDFPSTSAAEPGAEPTASAKATSELESAPATESVPSAPDVPERADGDPTATLDTTTGPTAQAAVNQPASTEPELEAGRAAASTSAPDAVPGGEDVPPPAEIPVPAAEPAPAEDADADAHADSGSPEKGKRKAPPAGLMLHDVPAPAARSIEVSLLWAVLLWSAHCCGRAEVGRAAINCSGRAAELWCSLRWRKASSLPGGRPGVSCVPPCDGHSCSCDASIHALGPRPHEFAPDTASPDTDHLPPPPSQR